ncbi:hypothetical protein GCM10010912_54490 [Paenibacillus albidus]|uniref:Phosphoribosyltransferase domain-containing protein n=1 Tax=Paenibacillus albidus TaxID=2041023 RepID=A0A917CZ07_9BACL|nr:phosphoribosyltransferase family protein [Paenibacillus albidus]GGG02830.1 hypothetical protein GCM10010912_54490 [Paenibacillus albidus]
MSASSVRLYESISKAKNVRICKDKTKEKPYDFKLYPFGERGTFIDPELIREITDSLAASIAAQFSDYDYIASPEPGGHTWGMLTAYKLMKPLNILRLSTELYDNYEVSIKRETAYNENYIYFDGFKPGDRVLLVDDVISSGATIRCIADQMERMGVQLVGVQAILVKGDYYQALERDYTVPVRFLSKV